MSALKLGAAVFGAFAIGGRLGLTALSAVSHTPINTPDGRLTDAATGAVWGGRVVTFLGLAYLASKV